jgi:hypothetical protein
LAIAFFGGQKPIPSANPAQVNRETVTVGILGEYLVFIRAMVESSKRKFKPQH